MNDPNGMVYHDGEYHLFFQHTPHATTPDFPRMHWGHAVSRDLVHWEELSPALAPDEHGAIFSGSAVVDHTNTAGLESGSEKTLISIFTYSPANGVQSQGMAYSNDKGRTWAKYDSNPVLKNQGIADFRDPKVFWYELNQKWIMTLAVKDHVELYSSQDLKSWTKESEFGQSLGAHGGVWECPELFKLIDDLTGQPQWVMLVSINPGGPNGGSATQYFVGDFDGNQFLPSDSVTRWVDYGSDNYAGVTWSNLPEEDGRKLVIGWMSNWDYTQVVPTHGWRGAMTMPRELLLKGRSLQSFPVKEIASLRKDNFELDLKKETWALPGSLLELEFQLEGGKSEQVQVVFSNQAGEELLIDIQAEELVVDRTKAGIADFSETFAKKHRAPMNEEPRRLRIYLDQSSIELFVNDGSTVMTELVFPNEPYTKLKLTGEKKMVTEITGYTLQSIWD